MRHTLASTRSLPGGRLLVALAIATVVLGSSPKPEARASGPAEFDAPGAH